MSRFVYLHFVAVSGTKEVACAEARNMVQCIVHWRGSIPEVDLFAMFLEEAFGPDDVDFFLYLQRGECRPWGRVWCAVFVCGVCSVRCVQCLVCSVWCAECALCGVQCALCGVCVWCVRCVRCV